MDLRSVFSPINIEVLDSVKRNGSYFHNSTKNLLNEFVQNFEDDSIADTGGGPRSS